MSNQERDTYSVLFTSLKHPIRRKILRILSEGPRSFSDIQEIFRIESSHLTYHLENLGDLIFKIEDGKYALSSLGEAAVSIMYKVEERPTRALIHPTFLSKRWKVLFATLFIGLIFISALSLLEYQTLNQLSSQYAELRAEYELMQETLRETLGLENLILTNEYNENNSIASPLLSVNDSAASTYYDNPSVHWYSMYSLTSNFTLEIKLSLTNSVQPNASLDISILEPLHGNGTSSCFVVVWYKRVIESGTYSRLIPSRGQYLILITAPYVQTPEELFVINYTMILKIKSQGSYVPFFITRGFRNIKDKGIP